MKHYRLITTIFMLALFVGACSLPGGDSISNADAVRFAQETLQAQIDAGEIQLQEQAAPPAEQAPADPPPADSGNGAAAATETPIPATATITLTPTPSNATVSVSTATNCRSGPGVPYDINGSLSPGQTGIVAAQASVNNYVLIQNPAGGPNCWLWLQHATISGDISGLPVVTPPPSPTPTFTPTPAIDWSGSWVVSDGFPNNVSTYPVTQTGNSISVSTVIGGITINFNGAVSADGMTVTGTYSGSNGVTGNFVWQMVAGSTNQFTGSYQETAPTAFFGPFCGARNGAALPNPCLGP